jgi:hypothetical protein
MSANRLPPTACRLPQWWERILGIGPNAGYRWPGIIRTVVILVCLVGLGIAGYFQAEHLILRAQLRRMNDKLAVLEQELEEYETVAKFLNDTASTRILESLAARTPAPAEQGR